jgi:putative membrane protein
MKRLFLAIAVITGTSFMISCGNSSADDAKKHADSINMARIDSAKVRDTSAAHPVHMADMKPDAKFAVEAADGGLMEVALGELAEKKGTTPGVRNLGAQMAKDHAKANKELEAIAKETHIVIPSEMSAKCQKEVDDLDQKSGTDFDKAYADLMVKDHKDDIDEFNKEVGNGNDGRVTTWAKNTLPVLEHHLMMSEEVQKNLKK